MKSYTAKITGHRMRALAELRRLDEEVLRLERVVQHDPLPMHKLLLKMTRQTRTAARRSLGMQSFRAKLRTAEARPVR